MTTDTLPTDPLALLLGSDADGLFDYLEFRQLLAGPLAALAARRAGAEDLAHLRICLTAVEDAPASNESAADTAFHLAVAETAHNPVMTHILRWLLSLRHHGLLDADSEACLHHGPGESFLHQHRVLLEAIAAGNAAAAHAAAETHLAALAEALREARRSRSRRDVALRRRDGCELVAAAEKRGESGGVKAHG